ncbi:hypothetical protein AORI_1430 [Amycolatopsis keratiniphila]|uniref:Uncharacterized protein n=1 Tax=Amycolatopsis keratiniphila TaxID=129921 RepID=R4T000_9PSEU|nr:hypothetical protein AORI_1430 [Amycolatopsis keratiniphila]
MPVRSRVEVGEQLEDLPGVGDAVQPGRRDRGPERTAHHDRRIGDSHSGQMTAQAHQILARDQLQNGARQVGGEEILGAHHGRIRDDFPVQP